MMEQYDEADVDEIREVLVGRRIVEAEIVTDRNKLPSEIQENVYRDDNIGVLTLDNGMQLFIEPNTGCGGCSSGWYNVTKATKVDNLIMNVNIDVKKNNYGDPIAYHLFVFTENEQVSALEVEGSVGSGYYGTGFDVYVLPMVIDGSVVDESVQDIEWKSVES